MVQNIGNHHDCQRLCQLESQCQVFTWVKNTDQCSLKTGIEAMVNAPKISGPAVCPCFERDTDFGGRDVADPQVDVKTNQECFAICHLTVGCHHFVYDAQLMICRLRDGAIVKTERTNFISGPKACN